MRAFGRIDLLIKNAGIFILEPFTDYTPEDFRTMLSVDLSGFFFATQKTLAQMRKQHSGCIVRVTTSLVGQPISGI